MGGHTIRGGYGGEDGGIRGGNTGGGPKGGGGGAAGWPSNACCTVFTASDTAPRTSVMLSHQSTDERDDTFLASAIVCVPRRRGSRIFT